jgi:hypothetical protein
MALEFLSPHASDPPTSGPHFSMQHVGGFMTNRSPRPQVHNLEDGGVLVQYNCMHCDDMVSRLRDVVRRYTDKVILAPYPGMKYRIAHPGPTSMPRRLDERRIIRFIEATGTRPSRTARLGEERLTRMWGEAVKSLGMKNVARVC